MLEKNSTIKYHLNTLFFPICLFTHRQTDRQKDRQTHIYVCVCVCVCVCV